MTSTWAYIAGFFDGEGCIQRGIDRRGTGNGDRLRVSIVQMERRDSVLYAIADIVEDELGFRPRVYTTRPNNLTRLEIYAQARIVAFLKKVEPFLIVRGDEARAMIEHIEAKPRYVALARKER